MLKKHLYVIRSLSCGKKFTIQQYGSRCYTANSATNYLNENVPDYIRKENRSPDSFDLSLLDYTISNIMKKIFYVSVKRYEDIEGLSAAISYAWDRLTKKLINNPMADLIRKSGTRGPWSHCTSNLTTPIHDSTNISIVMNMLFINRKLNMIK